MPERSLIIGDIGGTNARFALADTERPGFTNEVTLKCADFAAADDAIRHYLDSQSLQRPDVICLAVAGPVINGSVDVTNNHWYLQATAIAKDFDIEAVRLLNDFEAIAYSIPQLGADDAEPIGLPDNCELPQDNFNIAIVGPGTGLGTAGLLKRDGVLIPIVAEGGHIGFAPKSQVQVDILTALHTRFDRVSVERLVSGAGIENIYWALTRIHDESRTPLSASEIFASAAEDDDPRATETVQTFFEILGQVAGDIALVTGAEDGVYIAGGIAKRYPAMLKNSGFRRAFDNKGSHRAYMERIPAMLITHEEPGLLGAAYCALTLLSD